MYCDIEIDFNINDQKDIVEKEVELEYKEEGYKMKHIVQPLIEEYNKKYIDKDDKFCFDQVCIYIIFMLLICIGMNCDFS